MMAVASLEASAASAEILIADAFGPYPGAISVKPLIGYEE